MWKKKAAEIWQISLNTFDCQAVNLWLSKLPSVYFGRPTQRPAALGGDCCMKYGGSPAIYLFFCLAWRFHGPVCFNPHECCRRKWFLFTLIEIIFWGAPSNGQNVTSMTPSVSWPQTELKKPLFYLLCSALPRTKMHFVGPACTRGGPR